MRIHLFRASLFVTVLVLAASSVILADGLPEPDINVADYKSPPSAELLNLFDPHFKPPPPPSHAHPVPVPGSVPPPPPSGAPLSTGRKPNANKRKKKKATKLKKQGATPGVGAATASTSKGASSKKPKSNKKKSKSKSKKKKKNKKKRVRNMGNSGSAAINAGTPRPSIPRPPQFDQGEVDPAVARKMNRGALHHPPPPPFAADPAAGGSKKGGIPPPPPPPRRQGTSPPQPKQPKPAKELSYAELRAQQQKLYNEQRRRYAQLVKFHTQGGQNEQQSEPMGPPPSLDELRAMLHKEGLTHPPPFDASAQAGFDLPPETDLFSTPPPRMREYDLPPVKAHPKWKKDNSTRRKNRIKEGMVEQMAHFNSLSRQQEIVQAQKAVALEKMRENLITNLQSDKTTQQLRAQIETMLHEEIAKMSKEEVAAELDHILKMRKEQAGASAAEQQAKPAAGSAQAQPQQQQPQAPAAAKH